MALFALILLLQVNPPRSETLRIWVRDVPLRVEVSKTLEERALGLMYRDSLSDTMGMLFIFEWQQPLIFWMKNTRIPLSIAFINEEGEIVDIQDMKPMDLSLYASAYPARFALEVNRGWFDRHGIRVGDRVRIPGYTGP